MIAREAFVEATSIVPAGRNRTFDLMATGPRLINALFKFAAWLREITCDVIHVHHRRLAVLAELIRPLTKVPVLFTGHLTFPDSAWFRRLSPPVITGVSSSVVAYLRRATRASEVHLVYNPHVFPSQAALAKKAEICRAISIGRLEVLGKMVAGSISWPMEAAVLIVPALICLCAARARIRWIRQQRLPALVLGLALLVALIVAHKTLSPRMIAAGSSQAMNKPSPAFTLTKLDGSKVALSSLKGHIVVLDFWATWCVPCLAEMPIYDAIQERYKSNPDVVFLLVNTGLNDDTPDKVRRSNETRHLHLPIALGDIETGDAFAANVLPKLVILDGRGNIRLESSGFKGASQLQSSVNQEIELLLASK